MLRNIWTTNATCFVMISWRLHSLKVILIVINCVLPFMISFDEIIIKISSSNCFLIGSNTRKSWSMFVVSTINFNISRVERWWVSWFRICGNWSLIDWFSNLSTCVPTFVWNYTCCMSILWSFKWSFNAFVKKTQIDSCWVCKCWSFFSVITSKQS